MSVFTWDSPTFSEGLQQSPHLLWRPFAFTWKNPKAIKQNGSKVFVIYFSSGGEATGFFEEDLLQLKVREVPQNLHSF